MLQTIIDIITKKKNGESCSEEDNNKIIKFIKEQIIQVGNGDIDLIMDLQLLFPMEYSEGIGHEFE